MDGTLYQIICRLGLLIAVLAVGFWCVKFYKTLEQGDARLPFNDMVWPLLLIVMLSNGGRNMREVTSGMREMMNGVNRSINTMIDTEVNLTAAKQVLGFADASDSIVNALVSSCKSLTELEKLQDCLRRKEQAANIQIGAIESKFLNFNSDPAAQGKSAKWRDQVEKWKAHVKNYSKNRFDIKNIIPDLG